MWDSTSRMLKKSASDIGRLRLRLRLSKQTHSMQTLNLNLDLDLSLLQMLRPCWTALLSVLNSMAVCEVTR